MDHANHTAPKCPICGNPIEGSHALPVEALHAGLRAELAEAGIAAPAGARICQGCLKSLHGDYFSGVMEEHLGELDPLEHEVAHSLEHQELITSNVNEDFAEQLTTGQRIADVVAAFGGSWAFIGLFGFILAVWILVNQIMGGKAFDPYPFILLNLCLSCIAAIQAPVIMMSQNRHNAKDRLRAEQDYQVNLKAELQIRHLHEMLVTLAARQQESLEQIKRLEQSLRAGTDPR